MSARDFARRVLGNLADPQGTRREAANLRRAVAEVNRLHQPYHADDRRRCCHCIAGYDPKTGELVNAAWPCQTRQAMDGAGAQ